MAEKVVGVAPPDAFIARPRLFAALGRIFDVRFEAQQLHALGVTDAVLVLDGGRRSGSPPSEPPRIALMALEPEERHSGYTGLVSIGEMQDLDRRIRGRALSDECAGSAPRVSDGQDAGVLAACGGRALWVRGGAGETRTDTVSLCPAELDEGESLRNRLRGGRFLALLPLIAFLRDLTRDSAWRPPPLRAAFVIDDPNLHGPTYGHLDYAALGSAAQVDGYHVAMATVPLDGWFVNARAAHIFSKHPGALSLLCHGNDHRHHELAQPRGEAETCAMLAQALRRIQALERRSGLIVDRVMAAPHERCSEASARWMRRLGFLALCNSRPYPWRSGPPPGQSLAGWRPAELVAGGLPVLPRYQIAHPRDDLVFRAYLDQPLILFGHHEDVCDGFGALADAADEINTFGSVRWESLASITQGNFAARQDGPVLTIRMYASQVSHTIPPGIDSICVETPEVHSDSEWSAVSANGASEFLIPAHSGWRSALLPVSSPGPHRICLLGQGAIDPLTVPSPGWSLRPLVRRGLAETRDRAQARLRDRGMRLAAPRAGDVDMGLGPKPGSVARANPAAAQGLPPSHTAEESAGAGPTGPRRPTILADSWYTRELPFPTLDDVRLPPLVKRLVASNDVARGAALWWKGREHDVVALAGWGTVFKTVMLLERLASRRGPYIVLLQFILAPEQRWAALGHRSRFKARLRLAAQQQIVAPVLRRALARAHVMSSWEGDRNAHMLRVDPSRFAFLPWPLVQATDACPEYRDRGRRVVASGRTLCDWPTVFAAAQDQNWDLEIICTAEDLPLVERLNHDSLARVRHDLPLEEYREIVRHAAVHLVAVEECAMSTGQNRAMDAVRGGTPLVATRVRGLVDYVEADKTALLFEPRDFRAAREAVNRLLADPQLCEQLRTAAFERARGWTREQYMAGIRALVESAARPDPGPA